MLQCFILLNKVKLVLTTFLDIRINSASIVTLSETSIYTIGDITLINMLKIQ